MQTARINILKGGLRFFTTSIGLTIALTCTMFALLSMQTEPARYQCNCDGYLKKHGVVEQLFPVPIILYPAQPVASRDDQDPYVE